MPNHSYQQDQNYYSRPQGVEQNQLNHPIQQQHVPYSYLSNNTYCNSHQHQQHAYHDYIHSKNQNSYSTLYEQEWMPDPRVVNDIEKGLRLTDKIESIEITSKDLSPVSCCSNFDLLLHEYCGNKNYNKNYTEYPSCSQMNNEQSDKTVKYCSIQKPSSNNYDCSQFMQSTDCFQDVYPTNEICSDVMNFGPMTGVSVSTVSEVDRVDNVSDDSDIIVEDLDDEDYVEGNETEGELQRKFNCLICNVVYSPVGSQFYYLTAENPLTMSSQKSVTQKLKAMVGHFKDSYLCSQCLGLINTIDHLEMKLETCKLELQRKYESTNNTSINLNAKAKTPRKCRHRFNCKLCKKAVSLVAVYKNHMQKHRFQNRFLCEICGKRFTKVGIFNIHIKTHGYSKISSKKINGFCCRICKKVLRTNSNRKEHEHYCSGKLPFKCLKCNKKFATTTKLKDHVRLKHEKKFTSICSICNIGFVQISDYKRHMISHSTEKKFNCSKCKKSYKTLSNLNFHMKFHENKLPFICKVCSKGFMRKEYLESHMASHTGERNYACTMCEKKFVSQKNLDSHLKYHNGSINKKFCNICGKVISKIALEDHLRTHSNLKELKCDKCDLNFNTKSALQKHRKRKHDEKINE